ncbi:hypothetical protein CRE_00478 [Caenorhabditis remanei]|uniref:SH2 domain-containing protein n=1 Tax=Caenorhabditis remanei TaxID=31234 RepID=E3LC86_CAERE|nr:hypothetical protein CRE_00478 [Caenorhabditis remanei]
MLEADEDLFDMPRIQINHPDYSDRCLGEIKENQPVKLIKTNSKEWRKHQRKIEFQLEYVLSKCHYAYVDWSQQWYFENKDQYDSEILLKTHKKTEFGAFMITKNIMNDEIFYFLRFIGVRGQMETKVILHGHHEKKNRFCFKIQDSETYYECLKFMINDLKEKKIQLDGMVLTLGIKRMVAP